MFSLVTIVVTKSLNLKKKKEQLSFIDFIANVRCVRTRQSSSGYDDRIKTRIDLIKKYVCIEN